MDRLLAVSCVETMVIGRRGIVLRFHFGLTMALVIAGIHSVPAATAPPKSPEAKQEAQRLANMPPVVPKARLPLGPETSRACILLRWQLRNRKMTDGNRFDPGSDAAASKTLPLGTTAKVTNVQNGGQRWSEYRIAGRTLRLAS